MPSSRGNLIIVIFPYLFSYEAEEMDLGKFKLYPSHKIFCDKQSPRVKAHLNNLTRSFAYGQYTHINRYLFGHFIVKSKNDWDELKKSLDAFSTIAAFSELSSERSGANYTNFDYAVFEILRPIASRKYYFYQGMLNGSSPINIHFNLKDNKPETAFRPNIQIGPHIFIENEYLKKLMSQLYWYSMFISLDERKRILRAITWFNKSHRLDPEIDDYERLISLSIALESLFNASTERVQAQLLVGITALLGESMEMKDWLEKFYEKRSKILHGQDVSDTLYKEKKSSSAHIDHIAFARKVFSRVIKYLVEIRSHSYVRDLHDELISNERRLSEIKAALAESSDIKELNGLKVFSTISSLTNRDATGSVKTVVAVGIKLLDLLDLSKLNGDTAVLKNTIDKIKGFSGDKYEDLALSYSEFSSAFREYYFNDDKSKKLPLGFRGALYTFGYYASWRLFHDAFKNKKKAK